MRKVCLSLVPLVMAFPCGAAVIAARDLPPGTIIATGDLGWSDEIVGGVAAPDAAIGRQVRTAIYEGRPVMAGAIRMPVLVERNQIVRISYEAGPLRIMTEGRALSEGAEGDLVRVMNLTSRKTISALVAKDGTLLAGSGVGVMK